MSALFRPVLLALSVVLLLGGCDSPEERAEKHFQSGLELVREGKLEQAALEFQNALQENGAHVAARLEFARVLESTGNQRAAVGQYLAIVQQDKDNGPANLALARLSVELGDFKSAATYARHAYKLLPNDPMARALKASIEFREGDAQAAVDMAKGVLAEAPGNIQARLVLVAERLSEKDYTAAVKTLDEGIGITPDNPDLHLARLASLEGQGDAEAVGRQLQDMVRRFPENEGFRQALLQWYLNQNDAEGAIALMREIAARTPDDPTGYLNVAQLILQTSGPEAARKELQDLVDSGKNPGPFIQALARLDFELGNRDAAIAAMRPLTQAEEASPERRDAQILLAKMLFQTGGQAEANGLVDAVLAEDGRHVEALKLRASRLIQEDAPEAALRDMEVANQEAPGDPEVFTIMAAAHQREGAHELAGQRLNRAVEASNYAPAESARYARFLLADSRPNDAEGVLLDALRRAPNDLDLLTLLGQTYLQREDWVRARQVAGTLQGLGNDRAAALARALELAVLQRQGKTDDAVAMLRGAAADKTDDVRPRLAVAETLIRSGDLEGAKAELAKIREDFPQSQAPRLMLANVLAGGAETAEAERLYRELIAESPAVPAPYEGLAAMLSREGRVDDAGSVLDAGITATDRAGGLLNMRAELHIVAEQFDQAITLYDELYARDPSNVIVANNLATLLSAHRDDAASLEQAFKAARRLRGSENPYYQDTYGWILTRRGDAQQAVTYLEPAAAALTTDPLTQYHLGVTYSDLQRWDEARAAFMRALEIAGPDSDLPQMADAKRRIADIAAAEANAAQGAGGAQGEGAARQ